MKQFRSSASILVMLVLTCAFSMIALAVPIPSKHLNAPAFAPLEVTSFTQAITHQAVNPVLGIVVQHDAITNLTATMLALALIALAANRANPYLTWMIRTLRGNHASNRTGRSSLTFS